MFCNSSGYKKFFVMLEHFSWWTISEERSRPQTPVGGWFADMPDPSPRHWMRAYCPPMDALTARTEQPPVVCLVFYFEICWFILKFVVLFWNLIANKISFPCVQLLSLLAAMGLKMYVCIWFAQLLHWFMNILKLTFYEKCRWIRARTFMDL